MVCILNTYDCTFLSDFFLSGLRGVCDLPLCIYVCTLCILFLYVYGVCARMNCVLVFVCRVWVLWCVCCVCLYLCILSALSVAARVSCLADKTLFYLLPHVPMVCFDRSPRWFVVIVVRTCSGVCVLITYDCTFLGDFFIPGLCGVCDISLCVCVFTLCVLFLYVYGVCAKVHCALVTVDMVWVLWCVCCVWLYLCIFGVVCVAARL